MHWNWRKGGKTREQLALHVWTCIVALENGVIWALVDTTAQTKLGDLVTTWQGVK